MRYEPSDAVCSTADPDLWYPEKSNAYDRAYRICGSCPIQRECLKFSFDNQEEFGIWGGVGESMRSELLKTYTVRNKKDRERMIDRIMDERNEYIASIWDEVRANAERREEKLRKQNAELRKRKKLKKEAEHAA